MVAPFLSNAGPALRCSRCHRGGNDEVGAICIVNLSMEDIAGWAPKLHDWLTDLLEEGESPPATGLCPSCLASLLKHMGLTPKQLSRIRQCQDVGWSGCQHKAMFMTPEEIETEIAGPPKGPPHLPHFEGLEVFLGLRDDD